MNKQAYLAVRRSVRDNGLTYTAHYAAMTDNIQVLELCDAIANNMRLTDWLAMRVMFARHDSPAIAFKLTTPLLSA